MEKSPEFTIQKLKKKWIKENFENVGDDFAYKARSLHYNNKEKQKYKK